MNCRVTLCHHHGKTKTYVPKPGSRNRDRINLGKDLEPCLITGGVAVFIGEPTLLTHEALENALQTIQKCIDLLEQRKNSS